MFEVILACTKDYGIGLNNSLPWNYPEELKIFKEKTMNSVLLCGRITAEGLPALANRVVKVLSRKNASLNEHSLKMLNSTYPDKKFL